MQRPKVQSFILCQRCIACVRRSVRCIEDLPDHRQDRYEKKFRWLNGDYSGDKYELDPYANALYLFCGRDKRKIKALHFDKDGFVLLQKRLDGSGRFQWPTNASEARQLTRQQFRWLTEGLSIDQPKAIHAGDKRKDSSFYEK